MAARQWTKRSGQAQEALRHVQELLRLTFDESPLGAVITGLDFRLQRVNKSFCRILGYSEDELVGRPFLDITLQEDAGASLDLSTALRDGRRDHFQMDKRYVRKDGQVIWARTTVWKVSDRRGRTLHFLAMVEDVTDRRRVEEELKERERTTSIILDSISELFVYQAPDHRILWANRALGEVLHKDIEELKGRYCYEVYGGHDRECPSCPLARVVATGRPTDGEITSPDGRHWAIRGYPVRDAEGKLVAVIETVSNITDRKRAEQQLRTLNESLEQRVTERTALAEQRAGELRALALQLLKVEQQERRRIAHVLHEHFQQLLVAAKVNIGLLRRRPDRLADGPLGQIEEALAEGIRVSRSLTVELCPPILYDGGLVQALQWLGRWMHERHGLRVRVSGRPKSEPAEEDVRAMLFHAARELLFNVVKHAGVKAARLGLGRRGGQLRIQVSDEGAGFDPSSMGAGAGGAGGYGLFSIRERLQQIGGRLEIDAAVGQGTRVSLIVPVAARGG